MADQGHRKFKPAKTLILHPGMMQDDAVRDVLRADLAAFGQQLARLAEGEVPDAVHRTRVALRRLRAALEAFASRIDARLHRDLTHRLRDLSLALGEVRDAQVLAAAGSHARPKLAAKARRKTQSLRKRLKARQVLRWPATLDRIFAGTSWRKSSGTARRQRKAPFAALAVRALDRAWVRAADFGPSISGLAPQARHGLRKRIKSLRYMAEDFAPIWPGAAVPDFLQALGDLQAELGLLNDSAMAEERGLAPDPRADPALARADALWVWIRAQPPWWHPQR